MVFALLLVVAPQPAQGAAEVCVVAVNATPTTPGLAGTMTAHATYNCSGTAANQSYRWYCDQSGSYQICGTASTLGVDGTHSMCNDHIKIGSMAWNTTDGGMWLNSSAYTVTCYLGSDISTISIDALGTMAVEVVAFAALIMLVIIFVWAKRKGRF